MDNQTSGRLRAFGAEIVRLVAVAGGNPPPEHCATARDRRFPRQKQAAPKPAGPHH